MGTDNQYYIIRCDRAGVFFAKIAERRKRGLTGTWKTGVDVYHAWMEDGVLPGQMSFYAMEDTL